jgi:hypothetical protein
MCLVNCEMCDIYNLSERCFDTTLKENITRNLAYIDRIVRLSICRFPSAVNLLGGNFSFYSTPISRMASAS